MELTAWGRLRPRSGARRGVAALIVLALTAFGQGAFAQDRESAEYGRQYDLRIPLQAMRKAAVQPTSAQRAAERALAAKVKGLAITYDTVSGAARSVTSHTGYLTGPHPVARPEELAIEVARDLRQVLGLTWRDLRHYEVRDVVHSRLTGATHVYLRQMHRNVPVYEGLLQVSVNRDGRILSVHNAFVPNLAAAARATRPEVPAHQAVQQALVHLGMRPPEPAQVLSKAGGARATTVLRQPEAAESNVTAKLVWLPITAGETRLTWNFQIDLRGGDYYDFNVDAATGEVLTRFDWTSAADFRVYPHPVESPQHTTPLPPADARTLVVNPEDPTASPAGWFHAGTTIMDGNNVHACADRDGNDACDPGEPSCGPSLVCDFPLDLESDPSQSIPAALANLFYWTNYVHDVQYQYGFDEEAGNFQDDNFGRGGKGSDSLIADAQDGADHNSNCNALFTVSPDGLHPRMEMYTCSRATPELDGSLDNGVIVHEYGHGIAGRQVAGPASSAGCMYNPQSGSEGVSDWLALVYTAEPGDQGTDVRGIASYLFALPPDGTIRPQPYSTDPAVNTYTYESIDGLSFPHGIGSVWGQAAWEVYWALVDAHGFEGDLLNFDVDDPAEAGNKRALFYVNEGLKNTPCHPTFLDLRDGILAVAADDFGGEDVCLLWKTFAAFGLGTDAVSHGPGSTKPTNGFSVPPECATPAP